MQQYITHLFIDTVQNTKSFWVDKLVKEESIRKPLQDFITAQTIFTKEAARTITEYIDSCSHYVHRSMIQKSKDGSV